jgi:hypothetical protein
VLGRVLVIVALLLAQRAAFAHELWHLDAANGDPAQQTLCDFHDALGVVVGGADAPSATAPVPHEPHAPAASDPAQLPGAPGLIPGSRDPPARFPK